MDKIARLRFSGPNDHSRIRRQRRPRELHPSDFKLQATTVWSFPSRGAWATHDPSYRGNWSPYIPRNLILKYTKPGDLVLDQMCGGGTTLVEAKLLGRDAIGVDINPDAVATTLDRLDLGPLLEPPWREFTDRPPRVRAFVGDARRLDAVADDSVDLVATHPPYAYIIPYSRERLAGDLSAVHSVDDYSRDMADVARESFRVLKPGRHCAVLIGDARKHKHQIPISFRVFQAFLDSGFVLREHVIKIQHHMQTTREVWQKGKRDFLLLFHENLFIFRKLGPDERPAQFKNSSKWW